MVDKVELRLNVIDAAETVSDIDLPGYRLHKLHGDLKDHYAVDVSGNWRIVFKFEDGNAFNVNLVDYH